MRGSGRRAGSGGNLTAPDFPKLFDRHRVTYRTSGANVAAGHIAVKCPWCRDDPSEHLEIKLSNGWYRCFRSPQLHKGKSPHRLLRALLNITFEEIDRLIGRSRGLSGFEAAIASLEDAEQGVDETAIAVKSRQNLTLPDDFRPLDESDRRAGLFLDYLERRGFGRDVPDVCQDFDLHYATTGRYRFRVIVPVYIDWRLITWTARAIGARAEIRYLSLPSDEERAQGGPVGLLNVKSTVLHFDELMESGGDALFIVEGPLDAIKLDWYARQYDMRATCLFGINASDEQIALLELLRPRFRRRVLLFDPEAETQLLTLAGQAPHLGLQAASVPDGVEDPGAMTPRQIERFCLLQSRM